MSNPLEEAEVIGRVLQAVQVELVDVVKRAKETTQAEADLATVKAENEVLRERHARTAEQLRGVRSTMQATVDTLRDQLQTTEHERWQLQVTLAAVTADREEFRAALAEPSDTEESLNEKVEKVREYVKTIKAYETDTVKIVTDILYLIGEK